MKETQRTNNPYPNSDSNKRYFTYEYYLRKRFGEKCAKIPVDGGFTCPNIDGKCGFGGCIYCSGRGSGDFAPEASLSVTEQIAAGENLSKKWKTDKKIVYFQAHTNTYAPVSVLREKFYEALACDGVVGLNIATRADCLGDDVLDLLSELNEKTALTVELGLQTSNDETAKLINRGHAFADFEKGYEKLKKRGIRVGVHLIFGLPNENREVMLKSVRDVAKLLPDEVKIHLLYVIDGTKLGDLYKSGEYKPLEQSEYVSIVCDALELLPPDTVVGRLTGDGEREKLLAPLWSLKKTCVVNDIDKELYARGTWQGKKFSE